MIILVPAFIIAFIGFKMNLKRNKAPKLSSICSWIVSIGFGVVLFLLFFDSGDIDTLLEGTFLNDEMIPLVIIDFIVLLVINILTAENKIKSVIYSVCQTAVSIALIGFIILILITVFFGGGSNLKNLVGGTKTYTDEENQYAQANGFYDAASANEKGFDTSEANTPGFDYTQKKF